MIGSSQNNREYYPRKSFRMQEKETQVKFNPGLSINRPSNNWAQVVITHAPHVCSQHSFELPLRMNGMHRMQFDHARLDLLSLEI